MKEVEIIVSGGGVVGCLAALALATHTHYKIVLLEANSAQANIASQTKHAGFDARVVALAAQSVELLAQLGVDINQITHHSIHKIHVSDKGHIGQVQLNAADYGVDALGKVVALDALGEYLLAKIDALPQIEIIQPAKINRVEKHENCNKVFYQYAESNTEKALQCKLLLVSDGGQSKTRELLAAGALHYEYDQAAIITNIQTQLPHKSVAFERFTSQGPIAFLPMQVNDAGDKTGHFMSIVWCMHKQKVAQKLALNDLAFLTELQHLFGHKLGKLLSCSQRFSYPLALTQVQDFAQHRAFFIGNAAQSLHPIAGQGFNLGIRDVAGLINSISESTDPGSFECKQAYKQARTADKLATIEATDSLVSIFSNQHLPLVLGRNIGLLGLNKFNSIKTQFASFAMGVRNDR